MTITFPDAPTMSLEQLKTQVESNPRVTYSAESVLELISEIERLEIYCDLLHDVLDDLLETVALPPLMDTDAHVAARELVQQLTAKNLTSEQLDEFVKSLRRE